MEFFNDMRNDEDLGFFYLIYLFIVIPFLAFFDSVRSIGTTSEIPYDASHVPTFYAPDPQVSKEDFTLFLFVLPPVASIFGAIHLIAWHFYFPSHVEQLLWRIGSLTITALPLAVVAFDLFLFILTFIDYIRSKLPQGFSIHFPDLNISIPGILKMVGACVTGALFLIGAFLGGASLVGYMVARLLLLTEAVILLRQQPESAFYAISWSYFLPHL